MAGTSAIAHKFDVMSREVHFNLHDLLLTSLNFVLLALCTTHQCVRVIKILKKYSFYLSRIFRTIYY